jgi:hypothetical protein
MYSLFFRFKVIIETAETFSIFIKIRRTSTSKLKYSKKPLNLITLGQTKSDNINRMITLTGCFYLVSISKWDNENCSQ